MKKAIITSGISASGKSTFAREWVAEDPAHRMEINRDNIRKQLVEKDGNVWSWAKWNWKREGEVTRIANETALFAAGERLDIVISDTNLNKGRRDTLVNWLTSLHYEVEIKEFPITLEEAWKRDAARENGVGHSVIAEQYEKFLEITGRKKYVADETKTKCILVDIDGTLAHMNGKRGAFDWDKVGLDDVDDAVKMIVNAWKMMNSGEVIVLSGRDGVCREETEKWLKDNEIGYNQLIMRAPNDMRKDTIVKEEIFWRDIADNYNVQFVIDDRPCVIRLWQEIGLKTFAVGNQHIEF